MADAVCYLLVPCDESLPTYSVSNDLSLYDGQFIKLCPENIPSNQVVVPSTGVAFSLNQLNTASILSFTLENCCDSEDQIIVNNYNLTTFSLNNYTLQIDQIPGKCWKVKKTDNNALPVYTLPSTITGYGFATCDNCTNEYRCTPIPPLTQCACYEIVKPDIPCSDVITLINLQTLTPYNSCQACSDGNNGPCYELIDCEDPDHVIITGDDLSDYLGTVVQIESCPGYCFRVDNSNICTGFISVLPITATFTTCDECNPKPVNIPSLITRRVKPGYNTPSCPPEYTEKVSCTFGEGMYEEVIAKRYGIEDCCTIDIIKWTIKKELLNLRVLLDPNFITPTKVCYCYTIEQIAETVTYKYIDCEGCLTTVTILPGFTQNICSQTYPTPSCPPEGSVYEITPSEIICTTAEDCTPVADCECYYLTATVKEANYSYTDCDGQVFTDVNFIKGEAYICAQVGTVTANQATIEGLGTTCTANNNCGPTTCNCYTINPAPSNLPVSVTYIDCETGNEVSTPFFDLAITFCAEEGTVTWTGNPDVIIGDICKTDADCQSLLLSACTYVVNTCNLMVPIQYINANGDTVVTNVGPLQYYVDCIQIGSITSEMGEMCLQINTYETCAPNSACFIPPCQCVEITPLSINPTIRYVRCDTQAKITLELTSVLNVCTNRPIEVVLGEVSINQSFTACNNDSDCQSLPCGCARVLVQNGSVTINYSDCSGSLISENLNPGVYRICSSTEIQVSGLGTADIQYESSAFNCAQGTCNYDNATCYYFIVNGTSPITYYYYDAGSGLLNSSTAFPGQITTVCSRIPPYSNQQTLVTYNAGNVCNSIIICPSQGGCLCYQVTYSEPGGPSSIAFSTTNCNTGNGEVTTLTFGNTAYICSTQFPNFYINPADANYITIIYQGPCNGTSICNQV